MKAENILVTVALAEQLLQGNIENRNLNEKIVLRYAEEMNAGNWKNNGESIKIAPSGKLLDGQHRLHAILKSNRAVQMLIVRNVDESVIDTIDVGKRRSFADWLSIRGEKNTAALASAINILGNYFTYYSQDNILEGKSGKSRSFPELEKILDQHPDVRYSTTHVCANKNSSRWFTPSILVAAHYLFSRISEVSADKFFDALETGINLEQHSPLLTLRNLGIRWESYKEKPAAFERLAIIIHAWNAYTQGRKIKTLSFKSTDPFPIPNKRIKEFHA